MKYYISGPISGYRNKNREAFEEAAAVVKQLGLNPVTPFDLDVVEPCNPKDWVSNMKRDIRFVTTVDGVVVIDDWEKSKGAQMEVYVAYMFDIPIWKLSDEGELEPVYIGAELSIYPISLNELLGGNSEEY